jgi:hypothetical protein
VIYVPTLRAWTLDTNALGPNVTGYWFDPTTGEKTMATSPWTIPATPHADGSHDWVLVLRSAF